MNYGFLIDHRVCIGCHACSTACKQENQVPLGVNRTWVKAVEKGAFPHARRHFQVTRCNHCANPPCVRICPVTAMFQRADGIVDFDGRVCIGCKACLQACPYDAIYVDPELGTAAKCHFCAHRVEQGLAPACVVVCPERAIVAGDLDDPESEINRLLARQPVSVRRPEQGTAPKLFYIDGEAVALTPGAAALTGSFAWADVASDQARAMHGGGAAGPGPGGPPATHQPSGATLRAPRAQGLGTWPGPITVGEARVAEQLVQTVYNAQHRVPWHWPVPAYLVTKAVAAGLAILLALGYWLGPGALSRDIIAMLLLTALVAAGLTAALLVLDLERPERFHYILLRPNWHSWLTRGAFLLLGFSLLLAVWCGLVLARLAGLADGGLLPALEPWLITAGGLLGLATAAYTAFLFGQAEGRDLWQSALLPAHLVVQAVLAGAAVLLALLTLFNLWRVLPPNLGQWSVTILVVAILLDLGLTLGGDLAMPHGSEAAARAAHAIRHGRYRRTYWVGAVGLGHLLPLVLLLFVGPLPLVVTTVLAALVCLAVLAGLFFYEQAFVMAAQEVPNS